MSVKERARQNDAEATKRNILDIAIAEFARNGLSGSRIDAIADQTATSKRMIYYYFGDKEGLYTAALETVYQRIRSIEEGMDFDHLEPLDALRTLVEFTFDYQNEHEDFIRLVMIENIHHGSYLARSSGIRALNTSIISGIDRIYSRGVASGVFRSGLDSVDIHWFISALCFFNVSNRATFSTIFKRDLSTKKSLAKRRGDVVEMILRYLQA